jgi:hypothetical protein
MNNRTLLMYGVVGEKRPSFYESNDFFDNPVDPSYSRVAEVLQKSVRFNKNRTLFYCNAIH